MELMQMCSGKSMRHPAEPQPDLGRFLESEAQQPTNCLSRTNPRNVADNHTVTGVVRVPPVSRHRAGVQQSRNPLVHDVGTSER